MSSTPESESNALQRLEVLERQLAETQGAVAILLAMAAASCVVGRCRPETLIELRERVVSALLASPLRTEAVDGAEAAVATFLRSISLAKATRAAAAAGRPPSD
jgi:hypothetical protein